MQIKANNSRLGGGMVIGAFDYKIMPPSNLITFFYN